MTFKQKIQEYLRETVYFEDYIASIVDAVMNDERNELMRGRWNDKMEDYPLVMTAAILLGVDAIALEWLKEHMPKHWLIPYFENRVYGTPIPEVNHDK